jgi:hypothetical protein
MLKEVWNTGQSTEDKREKRYTRYHWLNRECYSIMLDLLTTTAAVVADDATRYVSQKSRGTKSYLSNSSKDEKEGSN